MQGQRTRAFARRGEKAIDLEPHARGDPVHGGHEVTERDGGDLEVDAARQPGLDLLGSMAQAAVENRNTARGESDRTALDQLTVETDHFR